MLQTDGQAEAHSGRNKPFFPPRLHPRLWGNRLGGTGAQRRPVHHHGRTAYLHLDCASQVMSRVRLRQIPAGFRESGQCGNREDQEQQCGLLQEAQALRAAQTIPEDRRGILSGGVIVSRQSDHAHILRGMRFASKRARHATSRNAESARVPARPAAIRAHAAERDP